MFSFQNKQKEVASGYCMHNAAHKFISDDNHVTII